MSEGRFRVRFSFACFFIAFRKADHVSMINRVGTVLYIIVVLLRKEYTSIFRPNDCHLAFRLFYVTNKRVRAF